MTYVVKIKARKQGAIGAAGTERRTYEIEANHPSLVNELAIRRAWDDGLEHIVVIQVARKT